MSDRLIHTSPRRRARENLESEGRSLTMGVMNDEIRIGAVEFDIQVDRKRPRIITEDEVPEIERVNVDG